jgi:hypothetical protein
MIIGVAIQTYNGSVIWLPNPNRHNNVIKKMVDEMGYNVPIRGKQGFITEDYIFVDREEAKIIARNNKQLLPNTSDSDKLFSEDIW